MTVGTGSWRPSMLNTIPCVEIEQHRLGVGGEEGTKKGAVLQGKSQFVWVEKKFIVQKWAKSFE